MIIGAFFYREVLAALKEKHGVNNSMIATAFHNLAVINSDQVYYSIDLEECACRCAYFLNFYPVYR
jgi:hypothetical protein